MKGIYFIAVHFITVLDASRDISIEKRSHGILSQCECWIAQNDSLPAAQGRLLLGLTGGTTKALFRHRREGDLAVLNTLEAFHFSADKTAAEVALPHVVLPSHGELGALFTRKQLGLFRMVTQPRLGSGKRTVVRVAIG
jgi:hypothetical protein